MNLREKINIEVEVIVRILLLIIIDKTSFIDFKLIRFNKVLRGTRIELSRLFTSSFTIIVSFF